ncbi:SDR family oxidoreductase [Pseudohalocynthiibacter aestuariivivens]|nr:SDR family oxidoreductase [Pseudohalocynthiibacter aestuariivivens]QIE46218.1 SDR family oxidoreductase [Pseudohalocynthiibacter aestuariivivens]
MTRTLLSFGHGYCARALTRLLSPDDWKVIGTTRREDKTAQTTVGSAEIVSFPGTDLGPVLAQATHLLISAGPDADGDPMLNALGHHITRLAPHLEWVGYLSTTGVYGDHAGGWVDETTPLTPSTRRGQMRVDAEAAWRAIPDLPLHIFRLAGIYGPGRGPFAKVRAGTARRIVKPGQVFSRIHVEDIAQVLLASIRAPRPGAVYNVCDDDPAPPEDVIGYAAELLHLPVPPATQFDDADMTPMARSFYAESKRVRNDLIKQELGITLHYPNYRDGLLALLQADN